tara:strand:- start:2492 stop:3511 length:1020 start_codon:yes stop_codon:yes gene_type:complete
VADQPNLAPQIEAFLRNALGVKRMEDRQIRLALTLLRQVLTQVERAIGSANVLTVNRDQIISQLIPQVAASIQQTWGVQVLEQLQTDLLPFYERQLDFARKMVELAGGDLTNAGAAAANSLQVAQTVNETIVGGKPLAQVLTQQLPVQIADRVESYLRLGLSDVGGETLRTYQDAVIRASERGVEAVIRTGVHEVGSAAQQAIYQYETDPDWGEGMLVWTAVLDSRVCPVCVALDGKEFPNTYKKVSPHYQCRCYLLPAKWRNDTITEPDGTTNPVKRPTEGDKGEGALSFKESAKEWVKANPETAKEIFGNKIGQDLADGKIGFDKALKLWQAPKRAT